MTRPDQATTGWPASCLSLPLARYMDSAHSVPVSADAQARMDADRITNHIRGRMLKIQAAANDNAWGKR